MFTFRLLNDLISFLDLLFGAIGCSVELTRLDATDLNAEVCVAMAMKTNTAPMLVLT
jgi:hypothetical protein